MLNEINWPHDYLPGTTDNFASNEVSSAGGSIETSVSRFDFGLKAGVYATWFFM